MNNTQNSKIKITVSNNATRSLGVKRSSLHSTTSSVSYWPTNDDSLLIKMNRDLLKAGKELQTIHESTPSYENNNKLGDLMKRINELANTSQELIEQNRMSHNMEKYAQSERGMDDTRSMYSCYSQTTSITNSQRLTFLKKAKSNPAVRDPDKNTANW